MKKIALHGSYFGDNFGDTLFVQYFVKWINELNLNEVEIILPFAGNRVRKLFADKISPEKGFKGIKKSECLIFMGGGYLGEPPKNRLKWNLRFIVRHLSVMYSCILFKKPFIFIGVGAGPMENIFVRKLTMFVCKKAQQVIVRDKESADFLLASGIKTTNIKTTVDSILSIDEIDIPTCKRKKVIQDLSLSESDQTDIIKIGIHLPAINQGEEAQLEMFYTDLIRFLEEKAVGRKIMLIFFIDFYKENYNYYAFERAKEKLKNYDMTYYSYRNPDELILMINELNVLFTTKLHCGIIANSLGRYTVSFSTHSKIKRLYKQLAITNRTKPFSLYEGGDLSVLLKEYDLNISSYPIVTKEIKEQALLNKKYLQNFLEENGLINE